MESFNNFTLGCADAFLIKPPTFYQSDFESSIRPTCWTDIKQFDESIVDFPCEDIPFTTATTARLGDYSTSTDSDLLLLDNNIENFFRDLDKETDEWPTCMDFAPAQQFSNLCSLPDRTAFCNDSCDAFLQESSLQLSIGVQEMASMNSGPSDQNGSDEADLLVFQNNEIRTIANGSIYDYIDNTIYHDSLNGEQIGNVLETQSTPEGLTSDIERTAGNSAASRAAADNINAICYPCTFNDCAKVYAKPAHLKAHLRRHVGDKPFVCTWPQCTWKFSRSDELSRHRRSHSGVKPYQCAYCTKSFARSDHLTKHRKVHERKLARQQQQQQQSGGSCSGAAVLGTLLPALPPGRRGRRPKVLALLESVH